MYNEEKERLQLTVIELNAAANNSLGAYFVPLMVYISVGTAVLHLTTHVYLDTPKLHDPANNAEAKKAMEEGFKVENATKDRNNIRSI